MLGWRRGSAASVPASAPEPAKGRPLATSRPRRMPGVGRALARLYDAAKSDRLTGNWGTQPLTADEVVRRNLRSLVARSREQAANNDYARRFLKMCRQNIVGPRGVLLQAQAKDPGGALDTLANDAIEAAWSEWCRPGNCDVTGRQSLRAIQAQAVVSMARDGEYMIRLVTGTAAGDWGLALQVLDPQRCPVDYDVKKLRGGGFIRHGIEFNAWGRPVAYHFTTASAEDDDDAYLRQGRAFVRIPADQIVHGFEPEMTGQKRGLPWMATALWRMQMLGGFEKAALVNARASAAKGGWFQWKEGFGPDHDEEDGDLEMEVSPGIWQELPEGVEAVANDPQYPSGEFAMFHKAMLRGMASGMNVTYVNLANDLEGVNFSSIRQGTLDEREHWKEMQEGLIEQLLAPIFEAWLRRALLKGRIVVNGKPLRAERLEKYRAVVWQPRRWDWIDPNADVKAAVTSKNNLLASPSQIIRDRGQDPETIWREIGRDIAAMRGAGIDDRFIEIALGMKVAPQGEGEGGDEGAAPGSRKPPED